MGGGDSERKEFEKELEQYNEIDDAWNVKAKFAYTMLENFDKGFELVEEAERMKRKTVAASFIRNRIYRPLSIYLINDEGKTIVSKLETKSIESIADAIDLLWSVFAVDMGHIIPKVKERELTLADRYKTIRSRQSEKNKKRASAPD